MSSRGCPNPEGRKPDEILGETVGTLRFRVLLALALTVAVMAVAAAAVASSQASLSSESGQLGDADCNGAVESIDALAVLHFVAEMKQGRDECTPGEINIALADVDLNVLGFRSGDGLIRTVDALQMLLDAAGLIDLNEAVLFEATHLEQHSLDVIGNEFCIDRMDSALDLLAEKAPTHHKDTIGYIGELECVTAGSGMRAYSEPPRALLGLQTILAGKIWLASVLVHESGHSKLYNDYQAEHPGQLVPDDIWTGEEAEAICLALQYDALVLLGASQEMLDYVEGIIQSDYWEIPYEDRWWRAS